MIDVDLPDIPQISARGWQTDEDWAHMARIMNAHMVDRGVEIHVTAAETEGWLANATDIDRERDYVFVDVADQTVAYALSSTYEEHSGRRVYRHNCKVDPIWQSQGIGSALLAWHIARHEERLLT